MAERRRGSLQASYVATWWHGSPSKKALSAYVIVIETQTETETKTKTETETKT